MRVVWLLVWVVGQGNCGGLRERRLPTELLLLWLRAGTSLGYLAPRAEEPPKEEKKEKEVTSTIDVDAEAVPVVSPNPA